MEILFHRFRVIFIVVTANYFPELEREAVTFTNTTDKIVIAKGTWDDFSTLDRIWVICRDYIY